MKLEDATPADLVKIIEAKEVSIRKLRQKNARLTQNLRNLRDESGEFASYLIRDRQLRNKLMRQSITITEDPSKENESPLAASFVTADDGDNSSSEASKETEESDNPIKILFQRSKNTRDRLDQILQKATEQNTELWRRLHLMLWEALQGTPGVTHPDPADVTIPLLKGPGGYAQQNRLKDAVFRKVRRALRSGKKADRTPDDVLRTDDLFNDAANILITLRMLSAKTSL